MHEMGRKGGKKRGPKGGRARMSALTLKERQELGRKAGVKSGLVRRKAAKKRTLLRKWRSDKRGSPKKE